MSSATSASRFRASEATDAASPDSGGAACAAHQRCEQGCGVAELNEEAIALLEVALTLTG
ncbi:hypothetical protein J3R03_002380 [Actinoplanes couchii]|uniref:Uncharacterized protein n=1 Tax=Actinoplanes couchii TaxID=403638 RepID=A0ABQ3XR74_9ACTN|nr:hypothetical protein [Actinoplanes couchii]GID60978.1 hypothetical protein Aco03nite_093820 [Actinoplanes couchii]